MILLPSDPKLLLLCSALALSYLISLAFYRLFFHPLAKFPGPRLAAITRYYEAYYDVWKGGMYIFKIKEMHGKYGYSYPFYSLPLFASLHIIVCSADTTIHTRTHCPHKPL